MAATPDDVIKEAEAFVRLAEAVNACARNLSNEVDAAADIINEPLECDFEIPGPDWSAIGLAEVQAANERQWAFWLDWLRRAGRQIAASGVADSVKPSIPQADTVEAMALSLLHYAAEGDEDKLAHSFELLRRSSPVYSEIYVTFYKVMSQILRSWLDGRVLAFADSAIAECATCGLPVGSLGSARLHVLITSGARQALAVAARLRRQAGEVTREAKSAESTAPLEVSELRKPPDKCLFALQLYQSGLTQEEITERLVTELGVTVTQGTVSRWISLAKEYLRKTGVNVDEPDRQAPKIIPVDPKHLELGENNEGRPARQRNRREDD